MQITLNGRQLVGILGSVALMVGVFAPAISIPVLGDINLFHNGKGVGLYLCGLAAISFLLILPRFYLLLWFTGLGALGLLGYQLYGVLYRLGPTKNKWFGGVHDGPLKALSALMSDAVRLQWGWSVMFAGAVLLIVCAAMRK